MIILSRIVCFPLKLKCVLLVLNKLKGKVIPACVGSSLKDILMTIRIISRIAIILVRINVKYLYRPMPWSRVALLSRQCFGWRRNAITLNAELLFYPGRNIKSRFLFSFIPNVDSTIWTVSIPLNSEYISEMDEIKCGLPIVYFPLLIMTLVLVQGCPML